MRRDEVLQNGQTLAEARKNRLFDDLTARLGHQTTQTGQLTYLCLVTAGTRIHHQANRVVLLLALVGVQRLEHHRTDLIGTVGPDIDHLVVAFLVGDDALLVLLLDLTDLVKRLLDLLLLLSRNDHVVDTDRNTRTGRLLESDFFQLVEGSDCALVADSLIAVENEVTQLALANHDIGEAQLGRPDLREDHATHGGLDDVVSRIAIDRLLAEVRILETHTIVGLQGTIHLGEDDFFFGTAQNDAFALLAGLARFGSEVIATQGNVLSRRHDRLAARRAENVQRRHHEEAGLQLGFDRQRHVHGHLVAVEVRVIGGANQRMDSDSFAFDEDRLERLHRKTVQCRSPVEQHRMPAGHLFEDIPDLLGLTLDHLLGRADRVDVAEFFQAANDEGLEEHQRHFLG